MRCRVWLAPPFNQLWRERDPFAAAEALEGEEFRALEARRTLRFEHAGRGYFVKIHRGVGWFEIAENLVRGRMPVLGAANELHAIHRLEELGVDTMTPVAFGERGFNPATRHSFLVTQELAPTVDLDQYTRDWKMSPPDPRWKRALISRVADMTRRMHEGGMNHRDCYLVHFLLHLDPEPTLETFRISLIDLHRAQLRSRTPHRWRNKDLAALHFAALDIGLTKRDRLRFVRNYFGGSLREVLRREAALFSFLEREGARLAERYARKFAPEAQK